MDSFLHRCSQSLPTPCVGFRAFGLNACNHPVADNLPLELCVGTINMEDEPAHTGCGVDVFLVGDKVDPQFLEQRQGINQHLKGASEPIKFPHEDDIELPLSGIPHEPIQSLSLVCSA